MTDEKIEPPREEKVKVAARPGSQWATGKRKTQKGFTQPKGFFRGARIK